MNQSLPLPVTHLFTYMHTPTTDVSHAYFHTVGMKHQQQNHCHVVAFWKIEAVFSGTIFLLA